MEPNRIVSDIATISIEFSWAGLIVWFAVLFGMLAAAFFVASRRHFGVSIGLSSFALLLLIIVFGFGQAAL
jgi:hypothetical protein